MYGMFEEVLAFVRGNWSSRSAVTLYTSSADLAAVFRSRAFSFENASSMGLRSGE